MKIAWYDSLYVGDKAKKKRHHIVEAVREGKSFSGAYVITPASNGNNILDIYPVSVLGAAWYREKEAFIIGIAADYWEALEVVRRIVDDMYQNTGGFALAEFLEQKETAGKM